MWIILSIFTAFFYAVEGAWSKKLTKSISHYTIVWAIFSFSIPLLLIPVFITGIPKIEPAFYWGGSGSLLINMVAFTLFIAALKISPLNMTYPFLGFTPIFLILNGYIFLGEIPGKYGIAGIILIAFGAYVLNIQRVGEGILAPVKAIKEEKGAVIMLVVAFLWSFAATFDKVAILASNPYFYVLALNTGFFILYMPFLFKVNHSFIGEVSNNFPKLFFLGVLGALMVLCQMTALKVALVSYVIAIKRSGMIFTLVFGWLFFEEKLSVYKITGTILMVIGIVLITVFK